MSEPPPDDPAGAEGPRAPQLVHVDDLRPEGYTGTCLRPLGLCDLGSCDVCWYGPNGGAGRSDAGD